jgi:YD repeat-containing protein
MRPLFFLLQGECVDPILVIVASSKRVARVLGRNSKQPPRTGRDLLRAEEVNRRCRTTGGSPNPSTASGETVNYTYDVLNRLIAAQASSNSWGNAYSYDGFGKLTGKTVTAESAPSFWVSYDPATTRQIGQSYEANGNWVGRMGTGKTATTG